MKWSPLAYKKTDVIAAEAGNEALSRLDWMTIEPKVIVDAGCGTGERTTLLQQRYPNAQIVAVDQDAAMVEFASQHHPHVIHADADSLPFDDNAVDLVFANLLLPWQSDAGKIKKLLQEWRRVLRPEGVLMFTALGMDTLQQIRGLCNPGDYPLLYDMHDCGDMLVQAGFLDPVLDVDYYTLSYDEPQKLWQELRDSGMLLNDVAESVKGQLLPSTDGCFELTYEVIHAHAFAPQQNAGFRPGEDGVTRIPLSQLVRRR